MNKFKQIEKQIEALQKEYIENIITDIWKEDLEDYGTIEIISGFINLSDFYVSFTDFEWITRYNIPRTVAYEYWDFTHLNFESKRCREFQKTLSEDSRKGTLYLFYSFCMQDDEEWKRYKEEDLKRSQEKVEEVKNLLFETLKGI